MCIVASIFNTSCIISFPTSVLPFFFRVLKITEMVLDAAMCVISIDFTDTRWEVKEGGPGK